MSEERFTHDAAYKAAYSNKAMVISLLRDFVRGDFVDGLDFGTLERLSGEYVSLLQQLGFSDLVWRVRRRGGDWCYLVLLLEFQSRPDRLMAFRLLSYMTLLFQRLEKEGQLPKLGNRTYLP